jgi:DNA mismatch endonuclease (patch repair protein)
MKASKSPETFTLRARTDAGREISMSDIRNRPAPLNSMVSAEMQRMPRESTGPEMLIRRELHRRGLRYRVNDRNLPGRPDIAFTSARVAVFIDGCFWHSCPDHGVLPRNNREWWRAKLTRNVARDREKDAQLGTMGWVVVHVWEHEDPIRAADAIEELWRTRRHPPARRAE